MTGQDDHPGSGAVCCFVVCGLMWAAAASGVDPLLFGWIAGAEFLAAVHQGRKWLAAKVDAGR